MRLLRPLLLALLAAAVVTTGALAQSTIPLPGGGNVTVKLPPEKGKKKKRATRSNKVQVGIADEKSTMFTDQRFLALGMKIARRSVAWDTFEYEWQAKEIDEWLQKARAAGVSPLISFNRSRIDSKRHVIPTRAQWLAGFREFRQRYPWVTDFAATNESNHTPPAVKFPKLAAQYYKDMRKACPTCRIAAATINERPEKKWMEGWIARFRKALGRHRPKYWALHNYYGANTFSLKGTNRFLKATKSGQVWITEVGGLVARRSENFAGKLKMKEGMAHSTRAWRFIFDKMLTASPRIKRAYLYHWDSVGPTDTWDSALVGYDGKPRGGLAIVQAKLKKRR
ncbi:MAG TPA: glycosyl hydrolase [Solirubrobacteraceae bacterium]|jgi:hypothetical protein|nr:glycosyl hydrolase [Solirubrobacteraceae bacterium]